MDQEKQDKLFEKYPNLFRQKDLTKQQTCMCWGIEVGNGWYDILDRTCALIEHHYKWMRDKPDGTKPVCDVEFVQIKEKFGDLRLYYQGGDEYVQGVVDMAEQMSGRTCEDCGSPGKSCSGGWIRVLCDSCQESKKNSVPSSPKPEPPAVKHVREGTTKPIALSVKYAREAETKK